MFGLFSQNFVLLIAFGSPSPASSSVFALYREYSEISFQRCPIRTLFIRIFRVLNTVQSFIFKVHAVAASAATCYILSQRFLSVNNFFYFFHFYFSAETSLFSQLRFSGKLSTGVDAQSAPPLRLFYSLIFTRRIPPCNLPGILQYPGRSAGAWSSALIPCTEP